jgi:hypothetical protein
MNYSIALTPLSASRMAAFGGLLPVRLVIDPHINTSCHGGAGALPTCRTIAKTGPDDDPNHPFGTSQIGPSRFHTTIRSSELYSIPITELHVAV